MTKENTSDLWRSLLPEKTSGGHKYDSGHAVIYAAPELTGATRLAAEACARAGAGLVSVLAPANVVNVYRETLAAHILVRDDLNWWADRVTAVLWGAGGLPCEVQIRDGIKTVLDADALAHLPKNLNGHCVLTPHEGEFAKAFPGLEGQKSERAIAAAAATGAVVVLKGAETVIAHPDGRGIKNTHASPHLATAGTGDVLAGLICGFLAQGMAPFEASCAAVWVHGECGLRFGRGLVASDMLELIPKVLQDLA